MIVTGIVAEYNPFHLGHKYHLEKAKEITKADSIIVIMSGNFMQRGIPAIVNKFERAKIAVLNGADLVIELPLIYSSSSAESFAYGAIKLLDSTKICNNVFFGMEHDNTSDLFNIAKVLSKDNNDYLYLLKENAKKGMPFHKAREKSLNKLFPELNAEAVLNNSNNILAIEYLKAIIRQKSNIKPYGFTRSGASYNEENITDGFASATAIRKSIKENKNIKSLLPPETYNNLDLNSICFGEDIFPYLKYKILTSGYNLSKIKDATEGLDLKIQKEISNASSLDELILRVKSKRYTYTRISRILTNFFIGLDNFDSNKILKASDKYIRPLAFNNNGRTLLKKIKNDSSINTITKIKKDNINDSLLYDISGTKAYSIINRKVNPYDDYLISPIFIDI